MPGTGRSCVEESLLQPLKRNVRPYLEQETVLLTRRSTPALPSASFSFDTSVVSTVLGAAAGFGAVVWAVVENVC